MAVVFRMVEDDDRGERNGRNNMTKVVVLIMEIKEVQVGSR